MSTKKICFVINFSQSFFIHFCKTSDGKFRPEPVVSKSKLPLQSVFQEACLNVFSFSKLPSTQFQLNL